MSENKHNPIGKSNQPKPLIEGDQRSLGNPRPEKSERKPTTN